MPYQDTEDTLLKAKDRWEAKLANGIDANITLIEIKEFTEDPPDTGVVTIEDERIEYTEIEVIGINWLLKGCTRGAYGSTKTSHLANTPVKINIVAERHHRLSLRIIELQNLIAGAKPFSPNLIKNGYFECWSQGDDANDDPDNWSHYLATPIKESTIKKIGSASVKLTADTADPHAIAQPILEWADYVGKKVTLGCWVYATGANEARIAILTSSALTYSNYHSGTPGWEWLTVTKEVTGVQLDAYLYIGGGVGKIAYFDGATLVEGESVEGFVPHIKDQNESSVLLYFAPYQYIPKNIATKVIVNVKIHDALDEADVTIKTGTATATTASHLIDTTNNQFTAGDVGRWVWNTTDNTYAKVTVFNSVSDVTLDTDIFVSGEGYKIYESTVTIKKSGYYSIGAIGRYSVAFSGNPYDLTIRKNNVEIAADLKHSSLGYPLHCSPNLHNYYLTTGDKIEVFAWNNSTAAVTTFYPLSFSVQLVKEVKLY